MKTQPIVEAELRFAPGEPPRSALYGDVYHPQAGALAQARHVFLGGNGLPHRWQGRDRFTVLETGFGLGHNFLATWQAWRDDPTRPRRLSFVSVEKHPPSLAALRQVHGASDLPELSQALIDAWPPATPNLHLIPLQGGAVQLLLAWGDVEALLPQLELLADAVYLDGFAPARNPQMWSPRVLAAIGRKVAPGATLATWSVARAVREGLVTAGFEIELRQGFGGKREMLAARFAPRPGVRSPPRRRPTAGRGHALVLGAGLAGAFAAEALARAGWSCTVIDRHAEPATEASGNPGGLFHATVHADDGIHARFTRVAALLAARRYRPLVEAGLVPGQVGGLLRMQPGAAARHPWPAGFVERCSAERAAAVAGLPTLGEADHYPDAGWISPSALCRQWLGTPGVRFLGGRTVVALEPEGRDWRARFDDGTLSETAQAVVLATGAADSLPPPFDAALIDAPVAVRGQISWDRNDTSLRMPLTGAGYALPMPDGRLLYGATVQEGDLEPAVRLADHRHNLGRLHTLLGWPPPGPDAPLPAGGRVGWRAVTPDRLPLVGAWPAQPASGAEGSGEEGALARWDQCRRVPRQPGLFVLGGLGSRGLTWGPLAAEILAAWVSGDPMPVEADLLDAVDPARGLVRRARQTPAAGNPSAGPDQAPTASAGGGAAASVPPAVSLPGSPV